jgi:FSR family fosmidomycin resistance protein-like MFS transporter
MKRLALGVLVATHLVNDFYGGAVAAMVPFLILDRGYSYAAATGLVLAATFLSTLVQPVFGLMTDRHRMGWLVQAGMFVAGLGVGVSGLSGRYLLTWLAIAVSGVGSAAFHPEASRSARIAAGRSALGMSLFTVGGNIGMAVAPVTVAAVLSVTTLTGTPTLVAPAAVMAAIGLLAPRLARPQPTPGEAPSAPAPRTVWRPDDWGMFAWLAGAVMALSVIVVAIRSFLPVYLIHRFGVSTVVGTAGLTLVIGTGICGTLLGGWLADRWGRVPTVRLGYAAAIPALGFLLAAPTLPLALAAAVALGLVLFLPFSVHVTLGQECLPNRVGTASGLTLGMSISAGGMATPLLGVLADARGVSAALMVLMLLALLALALSVGFHETRAGRSDVRAGPIEG